MATLPHDPGLDAALLLPPLRGALPADDPRTVATLAGYLTDLTVDGYAYRFRHDQRPLATPKGPSPSAGSSSRSPCTNSTGPSRRPPGTNGPGPRGPPELYSEEYDVHQHQLRGNLPQAFVHALHLETATRLADRAALKKSLQASR